MVFPTMNLFGIGFIEGILSVNPDATILQYNANSFGDAAAGATAVKNFVTQGADVVYHAAGATGAGVITGCQENGIYAIGVDCDQAYLAPETVITSAMKRVDVAAQDISKAVAAGTFEAGVHLYDLANGGVDLSPTRDLIPAEVLEYVEAAKAKVISGEIVVPSAASECPAFTLAG
jgi:basic membrane protein A